MLREQRRRREEFHGRTVLAEFYKEPAERGSIHGHFHVRNGNARPWTRRGNVSSTLEAGERSSDCALLRSALLLARSQLNLGVRPTFLTFARHLTTHRET